MQSLQAEEEVEAYLEKLKESLSTVEGVLHRTTAPNLKALEKMREVKDKLHGVTQGIFISAFNFTPNPTLHRYNQSAVYLMSYLQNLYTFSELSVFRISFHTWDFYCMLHYI